MSKKPKSKPFRPTVDTQAYRTAHYVEYIFAIEAGVLQAATLMPDLTDGKALAALRKLVEQVRQSGLPRFDAQPTDPNGLLRWLIVQSLDEPFKKRGRLSPPDLAGCLETVIESAATHVRQPQERRYLDYLRRFMRQMGLSLRVEPVEPVADENLPDFEQMPLAALGHWRLRHPDEPDAADAFYNRVLDQIEQGQARAALALCQPLLAKARAPEARWDLHLLSGTAHRALGAYPDAVAQFKKAQALAPPDIPVALDELAETYARMGEHARALETWKAYLDTSAGAEAYALGRVAQLYRAAGDLESEEAVWRDLLKLRTRRGWWAWLWRRQYSQAVLYQLADCLKRQGQPEAARQVQGQQITSTPHPKDPFEDWAFWVRVRLEHRLMIPSLLNALHTAAPSLSVPIWRPVLRACVHDWQGQPEQAAPLWEAVRQHFADAPRPRVLVQAREILGDLLPVTSPLFELTLEIPQAP